MYIYVLCHNFDLYLASSHGAFQVTPTPEIPSATNTQISQKGPRFRVLLCLGRRIGSFRGRWRQHQCILSSVETSLMLSFLIHGVTLVLCSRVLRRVLLVLRNNIPNRVISCKQLVTQRQIIKWTGAMNKSTCLFCHEEKYESNGIPHDHYSLHWNNSLWQKWSCAVELTSTETKKQGR